MIKYVLFFLSRVLGCAQAFELSSFEKMLLIYHNVATLSCEKDRNENNLQGSVKPTIVQVYRVVECGDTSLLNL